MTKQELDKLYLHNYGYLITVATNKYKDINFAKDLVNDVYVKLVSNVDKLPELRNPKHFFIRCLHNTAYSSFRKTSPIYMEDCNAICEPIDGNQEQEVFKKQLEEMVRKDIMGLPNKQKLVIMGRIYNDLSFKEISEIMVANYNTVKANGRHGVAALADKYKRLKRNHII